MGDMLFLKIKIKTDPHGNQRNKGYSIGVKKGGGEQKEFKKSVGVRKYC
jgi:hypothetical protein